MKRDDSLWKSILEDIFDNFLTFSMKMLHQFLILIEVSNF